MRRIRPLMIVLQWITVAFLMISNSGVDGALSGAEPNGAHSTLPLCSSVPYLYWSNLVPSPVYEEDRTLFFLYSPQLWRSRDNGTTWQMIYRASVIGEEASDLAVVRTFEDTDVTLYIRHWHNRRKIYGIARSTNAGITWQERTACDPNCLGMFTTDRAETIFAVRAEPLFPTESGLGILRSDDGGLSWQAVWDETNAYYLHVSPTFTEDSTLYGLADYLIRSTNGGMTWQRPEGEPGPGYLIMFSPNFARDHTVFGAQVQTLFKSQDGGETWQPMFGLGGGAHIADLDLSPNFVEDRTLFIATENTVLASYDDGANWSVIASGVQEPRLDVRRRVGDSNQVAPGIGDLRQERNSPEGIASRAVRATLNHQTYLPLAGKTGLRTRPLSLFLSTQAGRNLHYYHSDDGGLTWNCLNAPPVQ